MRVSPDVGVGATLAMETGCGWPRCGVVEAHLSDPCAEFFPSPQPSCRSFCPHFARLAKLAVLANAPPRGAFGYGYLAASRGWEET